jgi:hypothetical protein
MPTHSEIALDQPGLYSAMDLYRYAAPNTRQLTTGAPSYFSINNGATDLNNWNNFQTGDSGDLGDWAPSAGNDAFNDATNPGVVNSISQADLTLMNALGWRTSPASLPNFFVSQGALDVVTTLNGSNLPPAVPGYFNLEVITAPTGTNYSLPAGYQGIALIGGDGGSVITLLTGDYGVVDSTSGVQIIAGSGNQTVGGASSDTITGGTGNQFIDGTAGNESVIGGSAAAKPFGPEPATQSTAVAPPTKRSAACNSTRSPGEPVANSSMPPAAASRSSAAALATN